MSNIAALETSSEFKIQSVSENCFEVFDMLLANRAETSQESQDNKSSQEHRRTYKSTPNLAGQKNSAVDAPETW